MTYDISSLLLPYKSMLELAYHSYLNHATRVFRIAQLLDTKKELNLEKLAIACAFHDLGIWTNGTWDYLKPSEELCKNYLREVGKEDWTEEILLMIDMHHKLLPYEEKYGPSVELFRKADLVDFSAGLIRFGISRKEYKALVSEYSMHGFHGILFQQFKKHFVKKPWTPFPMVKV